MILTFVGMIQLVVGMILLMARLPAMFAFLIASGLFGGSAAVIVTAIGGSSIPPVQFALLFLMLRILMPQGGYFGLFVESVRANVMLVVFSIYGMAAAFAAPRIFAGQMNVAPLRFDGARSLFDTVPLQPTSQNLTAAIYLAGALLVALCAYVVVRTRGGMETLVRAGVAVAWVHAVTGVIAALTHGTFVDQIFRLFRNGAYAQLDQAYQGFARIDGLFPEASGFAAFGLTWFVFNAECWYRSILPRQTGRAALMLGAVLFFSTSSTAYVGLGCYLAWCLARVVLMPGAAEPVRIRQGLLALFGGLFLAAVAMAALPEFAGKVVGMIRHMTIDKGDSLSGQQRLFWALQGFEAFAVSWGLGIGPGSFRSSSLFTAMLGTMGVVGVVSFAIYTFQFVRPVPWRWHAPENDVMRRLAAVCGTTAIMILVPAAIASPNSHPGPGFAILSGAALALRAMIRASAPANPVEAGATPSRSFASAARGQRLA